MTCRGWLFVVFALLPALLVALAGGGSLSAWRIWDPVWILDSGENTLVCIGLPHGKRLAVLPLEGAPEFLLQSPDDSRLIVLDRGPGEDKGDRGYAAKGKSVATIVDAASREIVARVELGSGVEGHRYYFSADARRLTLLCPGYQHDNPKKSLPRELVNIDLVAGAEAGRVTLEHGTVPIGTDGRTLTLMRGLHPSSVVPFGQGRLCIVELDGPVVAGTVATGGWFHLATDGQYVYLLHKGWPKRNAALHRNGLLHVYSVERKALVTVLDAGNDPKELFRDEQGGQFFIPSDAPSGSQDDATGRLHVVRGSTLAATLEVSANPLMVTRAGEALFVVGEEAVTLVDPVALQVTATIPLRNNEGDLVDDDEVPTELRLSSDGQRAFILYGLHNRVVVLDLRAKVAVGSATTGRKNKELLRGLGSAFMLAGLYPGWQGDVLGTAGAGMLWGSLDRGAAATTPSMLAVHRDGRAAYAVSGQGGHVSVTDAATPQSVKQLGVRGHELRFLTGGDVLAVLSPGGIHRIDTATNRRLDELDVPELRAFESTPDGVYAVALGKGVVLCLNGTSGEVLARLTDFENPVTLAFGRATDHDGPGDAVPARRQTPGKTSPTSSPPE